MEENQRWITPWEANFREHMKRLRESKGMSQSELARQLKQRGLSYHQQTVQRVEGGDRPIRLDEAFQIASVLGSRVDLMIASPNTSATDLIFSVARVRQETEAAEGYLAVAFDDWFQAYNELLLVFDELLTNAGGKPTREVRWGAAWALKAKWMLDAYVDMGTYANGLTSTRPDWRDLPQPIVGSLPEWVEDETADIWADVPKEEHPVFLADLDPLDLNAYLQGVGDGQHPQEA